MGHAQAQQPRAPSGAIALDWQAPVGCPPGETIERDVVRRLAAVPDWQERVTNLQVRAVVTGEGAHWQLRLEIEQEGQVGQRVVAGQTCQEIADATSLLVAMTVDPSANLEPVASGPPAEPASEPQTATPAIPAENPTPRAENPEPGHLTPGEKPAEQIRPDPEPSRTTVARDDEARPLVELAIGPAFGTGGLPATGFGLIGGAALVATRFRVEIEGSYWFPRSRPVPDLTGASVSFRLATVGVRGCARLVQGKVEVPLCGGVLAGGLRGDSSGLARDGTHTGVLAGLAVSPGLVVVPTRWLMIRLRSDVGFNLSRPRFLIRNYSGGSEEDVFFRPPVVTIGLVLSLGFRF